MNVCPNERSARDPCVINVARKDVRRWECDVPRKPSQNTAGLWARDLTILSVMAMFYPSSLSVFPLSGSSFMGYVPSFFLEEKREAMRSELLAK